MQFQVYSVRCLELAYSDGVLAGLAHLPASQCEVIMHTTKRGEPLPINQALNRPRAKLGLDLSTWMAIVHDGVDRKSDAFHQHPGQCYHLGELFVLTLLRRSLSGRVG